MSQATRTRSARDFFAELVKGSQPRPEFLAERERWLRSISVEGREELLFEFEMLLRGLERYFNLHNLPFDPLNPPAITRNFKEELGDVRDALDHAIRLARRMLDPQLEQKMQFRRYVESQLLSDDRARRELIEATLDQDTPQEALFVLRQAFESLRAIIDHLLRLDALSYPLFTEVGNLALREIVLNRYFRPFRPLEFRLEYDRIRSVLLLEALATLQDGERRHFTVLLLALFRVLHYLSYLGDRHRAGAPRARVLLALVRSEATTLVRFLAGEAGPELSEKRQLAGAAKVARDLEREAERITQDLLAAEAKGEPDAEFDAAQAFTELFKKQLVTVARALVPSLSGADAFRKLVSSAEVSERLRKDLWVYAELARWAQPIFAVGGSAARRSTADADALEAINVLRDYGAYFQDVSYHLLRYGDFEAFDRFLAVFGALEKTPAKGADLARLAEECRLFGHVAEAAFTHINRRSDLAGRAFDPAAAQALLARYRPT